jgi:hypothetical protein
MKRGREVEDERAIHFIVEVEIEILERAIGVAEARQLVPAGQQPVSLPETPSVHFAQHCQCKRHCYERSKPQPTGIIVCEGSTLFKEYGHA